MAMMLWNWYSLVSGCVIDIIFWENNLTVCIKSHKIGLPQLIILHIEIYTEGIDINLRKSCIKEDVHYNII